LGNQNVTMSAGAHLTNSLSIDVSRHGRWTGERRNLNLAATPAPTISFASGHVLVITDAGNNFTISMAS